MRQYDAVVLGAGHNGLVSAAYLARAGRSVLVLERSTHVGGAAVSQQVFPGYEARLSAYSYLVSLLPQQIVEELALDLELRGRSIGSYTPVDDAGMLIDDADPERTARVLGPDAQAWANFYGMTGQVAGRLFPTMTEPLRSADDARRLLGTDAWCDLVEQPIGRTLRQRFLHDTVRGTVLTDGLIGTFADAEASSRLANRCLLYHVIGRGTGAWDVPVGGMGRVTDQLLAVAESAGALVRTSAEVEAVRLDEDGGVVTLVGGEQVRGALVLANLAPSVLDRLIGVPEPRPAPEGAQLKINMLVRRLPALRDPAVTPEQAFAGTFHVNEGYAALQRAYAEAAAGQMPSLPPAELYCHSVTDPSILGPRLQEAGVQTLTLFGLHMPACLFRDDPDGARELARARTLASLNSVLAEPIEDCLLDPETIDVRTPLDVEASVGMPGGHIFHGDLQWPWAEQAADLGRWGTETAHPRLFLCGSGARRGGGVSGIPGRNAVAAAIGEAAIGG